MKQAVPHLRIATPCGDGLVAAGYAAALLELLVACRDRDVELSWDVQHGGADVVLARQRCVDAFLADPKPTHLMFIDADITFPPDQVFRLIECGTDFAAAAYPLKHIDWERVQRAVALDHPGPEGSFYYSIDWGDVEHIVARNGFVRVPAVGLGFALLSRAGLTKFTDGGRGTVELFACYVDPVTGQHLSECFAFCRRWIAAGGEIWLDIHSRLTHTGPHAYRGDQFAQFEPVPAA